MKTVCNKNLDVFDFKDESPPVALRITSKLDKTRTAAIDKYAFLATAAAGEDISPKELKYVPSIAIDAINITHMATTLIEEEEHCPVMVSDSHDSFTVTEQPQPQPQSTPQLRTELSESEVNVAATSASPSHKKLKSAIQDLFPSLPEFVCSDNNLSSKSRSNEAIEVNQDENGSLCERSSSSSDVDDDDDDDVIAGPSSDNCIMEYEMDTEDVTAVVFYPDYMVYSDSYYTDSVISFTSSSIKMEGSTSDGDDRMFKCKWGIEDILHIRSYWHEQVELAMVMINVLTKDTINENVECTSGIELKFAVIGSEWYERLEAIASLNATYKDLWTSMLESENNILGEPLSKYLPNFSRPNEEVVYPKGDVDAVSISKRDFDLLQPDTFVNDTIIDFYIN